MTITSELSSSRLDQLSALGILNINSYPILIHGSIGHSVLMGIPLPTEVKLGGQPRDIDVYCLGQTKTELEHALSELGYTNPSPIDAGSCDVIKQDGDIVYAQKGKVTVELYDNGIFNEWASYEIPGTNGLEIRSFTKIGMLALHSIDPRTFGRHSLTDRRLASWFSDQDVLLPSELISSIEKFRQAYRQMYPMGAVLKQASEIYVSVLPESARSRLRKQAHHFMLNHAGRATPFTD